MKVERLSNKELLKKGLIMGLSFATTMAAFDYFSNKLFSIFKFIFHAAFFGLFMAISFRYTYNKNKNKNKH